MRRLPGNARNTGLSPFALLFFIPCLLFSFQDQTVQKKCVVAGRVTNLQTGEPLRKVNVHLSADQQNAQPGGKAQAYGGISDAQGYFRFEGVNAGQYSLRGDRSGFLMTQYGAQGPGQPGTLIRLQAGQEMTDLNLGLIPQAVITGRVVDEDGDPMGGVQVQGLRQSWFRGKLRLMPQSAGSTNDLGEYRIGSLAPGKYFVIAQILSMGTGNEWAAIPGAPQLRQVRTFFPDSTSLDTASPITVTAGQTASGMDIRLQRVRTFHVRGKVASADGDYVIVSLLSKDQSMPMFGGQAQAPVTTDRTFDLYGVTPGAYFLTAFNLGNGMAPTLGRQPIEVGASDLSDVIVAIAPPVSLRGRVSIEGDGPSTPDFHPQVFLVSEDGMMGMARVKFADDRTFSMENIGPGKYYPQISGAPDGAYLKSVRWGQQEILGKELDLSNGVSSELDLVFRYGAAQVSGTVPLPQDANKTSPPDFSVALIPTVLNADGSGMELTRVDQSGAFSFKRVTPGRYLAYALEQFDNDQLQNPDALKQLASKGVEVEVKEKDNKQIQLTPIPADDLKRIFEAQ
ncbi:MAG TPA: carboxypeptidase-like regulatory domain-containing protein [Bryobacteraceae bacterium]|nr:carboxypeptidase-like regulatory domain-containing protein [Bryobacteraceae bacterium]